MSAELSTQLDSEKNADSAEKKLFQKYIKNLELYRRIRDRTLQKNFEHLNQEEIEGLMQNTKSIVKILEKLKNTLSLLNNINYKTLKALIHDIVNIQAHFQIFFNSYPEMFGISFLKEILIADDPDILFVSSLSLLEQLDSQSILKMLQQTPISFKNILDYLTKNLKVNLKKDNEFENKANRAYEVLDKFYGDDRNKIISKLTIIINEILRNANKYGTQGTIESALGFEYPENGKSFAMSLIVSNEIPEVENKNIVSSNQGLEIIESLIVELKKYAVDTKYDIEVEDEIYKVSLKFTFNPQKVQAQT